MPTRARCTPKVCSLALYAFPAYTQQQHASAHAKCRTLCLLFLGWAHCTRHSIFASCAQDVMHAYCPIMIVWSSPDTTRPKGMPSVGCRQLHVVFHASCKFEVQKKVTLMCLSSRVTASTSQLDFYLPHLGAPQLRAGGYSATTWSGWVQRINLTIHCYLISIEGNELQLMPIKYKKWPSKAINCN